MTIENQIPAPKNWLTITLNGWLTDYYLRQFAARYLPAWDLVITSGYRDPAKNKQVGGAANSAHMHNLARDLSLRNRATGEMVTADTLRKIHGEVFAPHWEGFSEYNAPSATETAYIHANLPRTMNKTTGIVGMAGAAGLVAVGMTKFVKQKKG